MRAAVLTTSPATIPSPSAGRASSVTRASPVLTAMRSATPASECGVTDRERCAHGALRVVLVRNRCAEDGDDRVADELLDGAAESLELQRVRGRGAIRASPARLRGRSAPREPSSPRDPQTRPSPPSAPRGARRSAQRTAAAGTEPRVGSAFLSAGGARRHRRECTRRPASGCARVLCRKPGIRLKPEPYVRRRTTKPSAAREAMSACECSSSRVSSVSSASVSSTPMFRPSR